MKKGVCVGKATGRSMREEVKLVTDECVCACGISMFTYLKLNIICTCNVLKEKPVCSECVTESHDSLSYGIHRG